MKASLTRRHLMLGSAASLLVPGASWAQAGSDWPNRPVKVIVPSGAGGVVDVLARQLYDRLQKVFGQPFVIDNRPGANGLLGLTAAKNAAPDGYTIVHTSASASVMNEALNPDLPVKTLRDLAPVALTATGGVLLVVHPSVPAKNLPELVELIRRDPKYQTYGSWGVGSNGHLTMEWIKQKAGVATLNHVPYKTVPALVTDIVAGVVPIGWVDLVSPVGFIEQGKLRGIALNGTVRSPKMPDIKLMSEQDYAFPATGWQGVFAPQNTPVQILDRLHAAINKELNTPELRDAIRKVNVEPPTVVSRQAFTKLLESDLAVWRKIVENGNIKPE